MRQSGKDECSRLGQVDKIKEEKKEEEEKGESEA
jgi:hypothetical protein